MHKIDKMGKMDKMGKIAVIGYGVEGRAMLDYLRRHGERDLTVCDSNAEVKVPEGVATRLGPRYLDGLDDFNVIFRSPGVRITDLGEAHKISSMTKYFFDKCPCPVIGVSGTKGKGTCCSLIKSVTKPVPELKNLQVKKIQFRNSNVFFGGNIGNPCITFLDELTSDSLVILELSSFQLLDLTRSPRIAILLNTTSDHLDYHADEREYHEAKTNLLKHQRQDDYAILNRDYPYFEEFKQFVRGRLFTVSVKGEVENGAYLKDNHIYFARDGKSEIIMGASDIGLIGAHNLENVLPALCVGKILGIQNEAIAEAVSNFKGMEHRLEFVREVGGAKYYNDSASTNPETGIAAVKAFSENLILIAGGSDKGASFERWGQVLCGRANLKTVILIGETASKLESALTDAGFEGRIIHRSDMDEAVIDAYAIAEAGSVVLLSPSCASFGLFRDYKDRGEKFKIAVMSLR